MLRVRDGERDPRGQGSDPAVVALLSLKLLLLAFFILLTALAHFQEERVQEVVRSLNTAFDGKLQSQGRAPLLEPGALGLQEESLTLAEWTRRLFASTLPWVKLEESPDGAEFRLDLPQEDLFQAPDSAEIADEAVQLLRVFAETLAGVARGGNRFRLDLVLGRASADFPELLDRAAAPVEILRAGALVRLLAEAGVPQAGLSTGLHPGADGVVRLVFRRLEAVPVQSTDGAAAQGG